MIKISALKSQPYNRSSQGCCLHTVNNKHRYRRYYSLNLPHFCGVSASEEQRQSLNVHCTYIHSWFLFGLWAAWWLIPTYPRYGWRYFVLAIGIPALPVALFRVLFLFESPRFLVAKQKVEKAWIVFSRMAWINGRDLTLFLSKEEFDTSLCLSEQQNCSTSILQLLKIFKRTSLRRTLCLIIFISANTFGYHGATLFLPQFLMKFRQTNLYLTILIVFVAQIPGILLMSIIIEWPCMGRLNSLRLFSALSSFCF